MALGAIHIRYGRLAHEQKPFKVPHTFVLLFALIIVAVIGSYIIPAGEFDRATDPNSGRTVVVPGTFHRVEQNPQHPFKTFIALQKGSIDAADVVFFVFFVYASFYIVLQTGALHSFIGGLLRALRGKEVVLIPVFMYIFALGGSVFGMFEETFGFIPLFVGLAIAMGYDAIVGMCMVFLTVGMGFRIVSWFVFVTMAVIWTVRYALRIKKDPSKSLLAGVDMGKLALNHDELVDKKATGRDRLILAWVVGTIGVLIWGVIAKGWYFDELAGLFVIMGIATGLIAGWGPSKIAATFLEGCKDIVFGALVVGLSRGILVVMREAQIIDTVVYAMSQPLAALPRWIAAEGMLVVQTLINFFIPSGSGQAATTMPIMAPLSDLLGISRQTAVLAFQYGDGFSNLLWPTTLLPVVCSIAKIPIQKWWRFFVPFFGLLLVAQVIFIAVSVMIGLA